MVEMKTVLVVVTTKEPHFEDDSNCGLMVHAITKGIVVINNVKINISLD